jgi:hypothetical protein
MLIYDLNANPLNSNEWAFPLTECFHITSFALSIGTIMLVDVRLAGLALKRRTAAQVLNDTSLWTLAGLIIVIISGLMIFSSDPIMYLHNASFKYKVINLMLAIVFNYTVHRRVALAAGGPQKSGGAIGWLVLLAALFVALPFSFVAGASGLFKAALVTAAILVDLAILFKAPITGSPAEQKTAAVISLAMWVAVVYGGLWIAFV